MVPAGASLDYPEIWTCPRSGQCFQILNFNSFDVDAEVAIPDNKNKDGRRMTEMVAFEKSGQSYLAVADRCYVQWWDVKERKQEGEFSCHVACRDYFGEESGKNRECMHGW